MRRLLATLLGALVLCAVVIFMLGDRSILVPAPEVVVREFGRQLTLHRYDQARKFLSREAQPQYRRDRLRTYARAIEVRSGSIRRVNGVCGVMGDDEAYADAVLEGAKDKPVTTMHALLTRENGLWRIVRFDREARH